MRPAVHLSLLLVVFSALLLLLYAASVEAAAAQQTRAMLSRFSRPSFKYMILGAKQEWAHADEQKLAEEAAKDQTHYYHYVTDAAANNARYVCRVPRHEEETDVPSGLSAAATGPNGEVLDMSDEAVAARLRQKHLDEAERLLTKYRGMCYYIVTGWWTFEYCHQVRARQFHTESGLDGITAEFDLGKFNEKSRDGRPAEGTTAHSEADPQQQLSHWLNGGSPCDLQTISRSTKVLFTCGATGEPKLVDLNEPSTCTYIMEFATPEMCQHSVYAATEGTMTDIFCSPLV